MKKKIAFIASSGGHLTELLQLRPIFNNYDSYLITEKDKSTSSLTINEVRILYFPTTRKNSLYEYLKGNICSFLLSIKYFICIRPDIIISTGAGISVYMCYLAKICNKKIIFIETYAAIKRKSGAGKLIYPISDRFYVQWESMQKFYPKAIYKGSLF